MMFMNPHEPTAYIAPTLVGLSGAVGVIRYVLPDIVRNLKRGIFLTKRYILISISNLNYSIQRSLLLFSLMTVAVTGMLAILASNIHSPREFTTGVIGYVVVIVLLVVSIIYKLSMEAMTRKTLFLNLWKIGYTKKELNKIVRQEVISYYFVLILIPLVYIVFISGRFIYYGDMSLQFAFIYVLSYVIPIIISGFITYVQYINAVVKPKEENKMERKEILVADKITKIYGIGTKTLYEALHEVSLTMYEGEFVCIMGPSGAGKSTFINNLSTIDIPTKGKVFINGKEVRVMSEGEIGKFRYENLGFIFQEFNLLDSLTIFENIAVPLTLANVDKKEITKRVEEVAKKLDVAQTLDKYPNECSGGQRQRVAICRALVTNPKLIVADEPTGNLDSKNSHEILSLFKELNEKEGVSILMVTHDSKIASYSSKLLYIKDGIIDRTIEREGLSQKEYFYKIVDINSSESQELFE